MFRAADAVHNRHEWIVCYVKIISSGYKTGESGYNKDELENIFTPYLWMAPKVTAQFIVAATYSQLYVCGDNEILQD